MKIRLVPAACLALCAVAVQAAPPKATESPTFNQTSTSLNSGAQVAPDVAALAKRLEGFTSLQGDFTQLLVSKEGKTLQTTTGQFRFKRPGLYYWQSDEPYPQSVVGNGKQVWVYDPDLEQVTINPQSKMPYNPATLLAGGVDDINARYHVSASEAAKPYAQHFELTPKESHLAKLEQAPFVLLTLTFDHQFVRQLTFTDRLGQQTHITFNNTQLNQPINSAVFDFVPPKGSDVLVND